MQDDTHIITARGTYKYDPESDVYRMLELTPETHWDKFGWLYILVLGFGLLTLI